MCRARVSPGGARPPQGGLQSEALDGRSAYHEVFQQGGRSRRAPPRPRGQARRTRGQSRCSRAPSSGPPRGRRRNESAMWSGPRERRSTVSRRPSGRRLCGAIASLTAFPLDDAPAEAPSRSRTWSARMRLPSPPAQPPPAPRVGGSGTRSPHGHGSASRGGGEGRNLLRQGVVADAAQLIDVEQREVLNHQRVRPAFRYPPIWHGKAEGIDNIPITVLGLIFLTWESHARSLHVLRIMRSYRPSSELRSVPFRFPDLAQTTRPARITGLRRKPLRCLAGRVDERRASPGERDAGLAHPPHQPHRHDGDRHPWGTTDAGVGVGLGGVRRGKRAAAVQNVAPHGRHVERHDRNTAAPVQRDGHPLQHDPLRNG